MNPYDVGPSIATTMTPFAARQGALTQKLRDLQAKQQIPQTAPSVGGYQPVVTTHSPVAGSDPAFESFVNSIARQESGGNYRAVNKSSGALGKYQIMPANVPNWSKQALGRSVSANEFLSNPDLQEQIARFMLGQYYRKYGVQGAAKAWYGGEGSVNKNSNRTEAGGYPSLNSYAAQVASRVR